MNYNDLYESDIDSDLEDLVNSGMDIQIIYLDSIDQLLQHEKELKKIGDFDHNSNIAQYIIVKSTNN